MNYIHFPKKIKKILKIDMNVKKIVDFVINRNKTEKLKRFAISVIHFNKIINYMRYKSLSIFTIIENSFILKELSDSLKNGRQKDNNLFG